MRIAKIFGINIKANPFFLGLFGLLFFLGRQTEGFIVFGVVILHELAHAITAINYNYRVREIELLPFGGVAKLEQGLEADPGAEILVALAGPLANFLLVGLVCLFENMGLGNRQWVPFFIECNLTLGLFNLLPAYPLDGGRVYRAFQVERMGIKKATEQAMTISRYIAGLLIVWGLLKFAFKFNGTNLLVIGCFLLYEAFREKGNTMFLFMKYLNRKRQDLKVQQLMVARHVVALEEVYLKELLAYFIPQKYHLVVRVNAQNQITGIFTETEIITAVMEGNLNITLGEL